MMQGVAKQYGFEKQRFGIPIIIILAGTIFGVVIEILQPILQNDRYFDMLDIIANAAGCVIGFFIFNFVYSKKIN